MSYFFFKVDMHYNLTETTDEVFELTATFNDADYDEFIKIFPHIPIGEINSLWFNSKAKIVHDIGKTFCPDARLICTVEDSIFPTITYDFDLKHHAVRFDDCDSCELEDQFALAFENYQSDLETMLYMMS